MRRVTLRHKIGLVIFGIFLCIILLEIGLRIGGHIFLYLEQGIRNKVSLKEKSEFRILCLGESTTAWGGSKSSWPAQLEKILNNSNTGIKFKVINKGRYSIVSSVILSELENNLNKYNFDMVITMIGLNDGDYTVPFEYGLTVKLKLFVAGFRVKKLAEVIWNAFGNKIETIKLHRSKRVKVKRCNGGKIVQPMSSVSQMHDPEAEEVLKKAIIMDSKNDVLYADLGHLYNEQARYKEAEEMFKKTIALNPEDESAYYGLLVCLKDQSRYKEAEEIFNKVVELNPKNDAIYAELGHLYNKEEKYREAEVLFKKAIALNPGNVSTYGGLGACYKGQGRYKKAEEVLKKAIIMDSKNDVIYADLGHLYNEQERYKEAEEMFKKAIALNPENKSAYDGLESCYKDQGQSEKIEEIFRKSIALNPENDFLWTRLGNLCIRQGKYPEAEMLFKKAIQINSENGIAYTSWGISYKEQARYKEAEEMFKKAIEITPKNIDAYVYLGALFKDQEKYKEAEEILKKAIKLNPKNPDGYTELAICYREQGDKREQTKNFEEELYKEAIEAGSDNDWRYIQLGWFYMDMYRYPEAEEEFKKAMELNPRNAVPYVELGNYYKKHGKFKEHEKLIKKAIKYYEKNLHLDPKSYLSDRLYGYLAVYYLKQGDYASAERYFKKAKSIRLKYYPHATRHNYQKLKDIVTARGIQLVCVQYPMRSIEPLKKLFDSTKGIIFVDNEKVFKEALKYGRYEDYFEDQFAGDFGHGTPEGNRLLAENIVSVILGAYFKK